MAEEAVADVEGVGETTREDTYTVESTLCFWTVDEIHQTSKCVDTHYNKISAPGSFHCHVS